MKKKVYDFAVKNLYPISAEVAAKELERIKNLYGELTPDLVVQESKDTSSPLHCIFNWDDVLAAEAWRREQARKLICSIRVTIVEEKIKGKFKGTIKETPVVRAFVNVRKDKESLRSYQSIEEAVVNDFSYSDLLQQSKRDMEAFIETYDRLVELEEVKSAMKKVLEQS